MAQVLDPQFPGTGASNQEIRASLPYEMRNVTTNHILYLMTNGREKMTLGLLSVPTSTPLLDRIAGSSRALCPPHFGVPRTRGPSVPRRLPSLPFPHKLPHLHALSLHHISRGRRRPRGSQHPAYARRMPKVTWPSVCYHCLSQLLASVRATIPTKP